MNKTCYRCFYKYDSEYEICPFCGQIEDQEVGEPQYLKPGTILQDRYLLGVVVGAGGFGITYAAWDQVLDQKVAVKEFLPGEFSTRMPGQTAVTVYGGEKTEQFETGKNKFYEESRRLARFHEVPGIVRIYNSFEENGTAYIVMEYLEGETLAERLKREKKIPEQEAVQIILPVLQALDAVHKEGILHRDIAPNNIFLTKGGEVKLLDFGAARSVTGTHSKSLTVLYKEGYTPEEQYRSRGDQGTWTDVYACAATLYHMLTGRVPLGALERRRKDTLKSPAHMGSKISPQVDFAVMNALNVDIHNRTRTARQFMEELVGDGKVRDRFTRTQERKVGKIPLAVKVLIGTTAVSLIVFSLCLFAEVIHFNVDGFGTFTIQGGKSRVPNVINQDLEKAQVLLGKRNLAFKIVDKQFSNEIPKDKVLLQSPEAGEIVDQDTVLELVVSGGEKNAENGYVLKEGETFVPDVQYKPLEEAKELLEKAELQYLIAYEINPAVEEGNVVEQEKKAGDVLRKGEEVGLTVSGEDPLDVLLREAQKYMTEQKYKSAAEKYEELFALDPSRTEAYEGAADARVKLEQYEAALEIAQKGYENTGNGELQAKSAEIEQVIKDKEQEQKVLDGAIAKLRKYWKEDSGTSGIVDYVYVYKPSEFEVNLEEALMNVYGTKEGWIVSIWGTNVIINNIRGGFNAMYVVLKKNGSIYILENSGYDDYFPTTLPYDYYDY